MNDRLRRSGLTSSRTILIDGATGTELEKRGVPMHDKAWCGLTALTHGHILREVHLDYIRNGAQVITTDTFGSSKHVMEDSGIGEHFREVNREAARIARAAANQHQDREVWVGGSICTSFVAGNEIIPVDRQRALEGFEEQLGILVDEGVDLIMLEMALAHLARVGIDLTVAVLERAIATGLPVWLGISAMLSKDGKTVLLLGGEDPYHRKSEGSDATLPLDERIRPVLDAGPDAVGIMHTDVAACAPALDVLSRLWDGPLTAYPHSGYWENPTWNFDSVMAPETYASEAIGWIRQGAAVVGGCCGIGPDHIAAVQRHLEP